MKFALTNLAGIACGCVYDRDEKGREVIVKLCEAHDSEYRNQRIDDLERHAVERFRLNEEVK
jgi:predicted ATP-dependent endonuclease of OLD family